MHGWWLPRVTLVQLAALMRRDAIVVQLVRAGARPFSSPRSAWAWVAGDGADPVPVPDTDTDAEEDESCAEAAVEQTSEKGDGDRKDGNVDVEAEEDYDEEQENDEDEESDTRLVRAARGFLARLRAQHAAWVVVGAVFMRQRAVAAADPNNSSAPDPAAASDRESQRDRPTAARCPSERVVPRARCVICRRSKTRNPVMWRCG